MLQEWKQEAVGLLPSGQLNIVREAPPAPGLLPSGQLNIVDYNPDQPRDPAGTPTGGQWTSAGGSSGSWEPKGSNDERKGLGVSAKHAEKQGNHEKAKELRQRVYDSFNKERTQALADKNFKRAAELAANAHQYATKHKLDFHEYKDPKPTFGAGSLAHTAKPSDPREDFLGKFADSPSDRVKLGHLYDLAKEDNPHIANPGDKVNDWLSAEGEDPRLTQGDLAHVKAYTNDSFHTLNRQLRAGAMTEATWNHTRHLNEALSKLPDFQGQVWRRASLTPEVAALYRPGMIVEERGFTSSTSRVPPLEQPANGHRYLIESRTGRAIDHLSHHRGEKEVLFRAGTRFRVMRVDGRIIHLREV